MEGFNSNILKDIFSGKNKDPLALYKTLIDIATPEMADTLLDKIDVIKYGGDLLYITILKGKSDFIPYLLKKGASILSPPESIQDDVWYRKSPFII